MSSFRKRFPLWAWQEPADWATNLSTTNKKKNRRKMFKRILVNSATRRVFSVRNMGGGHHHAPPQGGLDGVVRKYLPEDYQVIFLIQSRIIFEMINYLTVFSKSRLSWELWDFTLPFISFLS